MSIYEYEQGRGMDGVVIKSGRMDGVEWISGWCGVKGMNQWKVDRGKLMGISAPNQRFRVK